MSKYLFALAITVSGASAAMAYDLGDAGANASQWANGCCEHEPMWSDHLWDDYCAEKNAPKEPRCRKGRSCRSCSNAGMPGVGRWRPRGGCSHGNCFNSGSCEAPIYMDAVSHGEGCTCPQCSGASAAPAHGVGCMCPACQAAATPAQHGPGCLCPQCQAAATSTPATEILSPAPAPHTEEFQFESSEGGELPSVPAVESVEPSPIPVPAAEPAPVEPVEESVEEAVEESADAAEEAIEAAKELVEEAEPMPALTDEAAFPPPVKNRPFDLDAPETETE